MYAIAADNGEMKPYDLNVQKNNYDDSNEKAPNNIIEDAPLAQEAMQEKFQAMYRISEDRKSITVIAEDYLHEFWQSNYEEVVIHSLSIEEVYFIIQDSIRIYAEYETIILPEFSSLTSTDQIAERFPRVEKQVIHSQRTLSHCDYNKDIVNIYDIIFYRLTVLSSPEAFISAWDAMEYVGKIPEIDSSFYPRSTFYIPGFNDKTDRNYLLTMIGEKRILTDWDVRVDLICISASGDNQIDYISSEGVNQIYPTAEMEKSRSAFFMGSSDEKQ